MNGYSQDSLTYLANQGSDPEKKIARRELQDRRDAMESARRDAMAESNKQFEMEWLEKRTQATKKASEELWVRTIEYGAAVTPVVGQAMLGYEALSREDLRGDKLSPAQRAVAGGLVVGPPLLAKGVQKAAPLLRRAAPGVAAEAGAAGAGRGAPGGRRRARRPPPPRGRYLPDVVGARAELDGFDIVEGLVIEDGPEVEVLNGVSLHGGSVASWPGAAPVATALTVASLTAHWREVGLPAYARFDNDMIFQGTHRYPDALGRVSRLCLSLGVVPVFVPPREMGFRAMIESYNGWRQARVRARFQHPDPEHLQERSRRHVAALRGYRAARIEAAPARRAFPVDRVPKLSTRPRGRLVYLRRTSAAGEVALSGRTWAVITTWPNRPVRCEVDLNADKLRVFTLRCREPTSQPCVPEVDYRLPNRGFQG